MRYLLLLSLLGSTACSHLSPRPEPGCLKVPPPDLETVQAVPCGGVGTACLDQKNTASLVRNVDKMQDYIDMAWKLCGIPVNEKEGQSQPVVDPQVRP